MVFGVGCRYLGNFISIFDFLKREKLWTAPLSLDIPFVSNSQLERRQSDRFATTITQSNMNKRILVVDDEPDAVELIGFNLKAAGFDVITAEDGESALSKARQFFPDLIVLDVMLPAVDGLEVCKILRRNTATSCLPIVMLTARAGEIDRVLGLELGADDYLTKPFSPRELVLRIKNLLNRRPKTTRKLDYFQLSELTIDVPSHLVKVGNKRIDLTPTEFNLLALLAERRGRVQSRERLIQDVWKYNSNLIDTRTVDMHIHRLREKLDTAGRFLDTVRGVGYRFLND